MPGAVGAGASVVGANHNHLGAVSAGFVDAGEHVGAGVVGAGHNCLGAVGAGAGAVDAGHNRLGAGVVDSGQVRLRPVRAELVCRITSFSYY